MEKFITHELMEKANSAEELLALAKENGIELSPMEASTAYTKLHPQGGTLTDEEMGNGQCSRRFCGTQTLLR